MRRARCHTEHRRRRTWLFVTGAVLCAGLTGGLVSPVWAAPAPDPGAGDVQLGSFSLADGLEGTIGELDGSFGFSLPAGGIQLAWDSRAAGSEAGPLGRGWSFGVSKIRVTGGVWVHPASGGAFEMDASAPTGLAGYPRNDVSFAAAETGAVVPARADGSVGETPYAYVLHELGGVSTYYDAAGYPVARVVLGGDRLDWRWEPGGSGSLLEIVTADGLVTELDWSDPSMLVIVPGANVTDPAEGAGAGGRWEVSLDGGRVSGLSDSSGGQIHVGYTSQGLVERVSTPSGGTTMVDWRSSPDGVARVDRVRLVDDATGAELSARHWAAHGQVAPTGWPLVGDGGGLGPATPAADAPAYETTLSDGKTRFVSTVDADGRVTEREIVIASSTGERIVQGQSFEYPEAEGPTGSPVGRSPISATTTHHGVNGESRSAAETYAFDDLGRMVSRTTADGATTRRTYDPEIVPGRALPVGRVVEETTTARDGLIISTRSELDDDRVAVMATETWSGREGGDLTRTGRVERDVEDGFVSEERVFPGGDAEANPVVTRWSRQLDHATGTKTVTQTVAAGTSIAASVTSVSSLVHGGALIETDAVGNRTTGRYDAVGRLISVEDEAGLRAVREYRTRQTDGVNAVTVSASTGVSTTETHDVLGRVVQKSDNIAPSGHAVEGYERVFETREHDVPGVERVTDAWGASTTTEHDLFGRQVRRTLANGVVQSAEFDDVAGSATSGVSLTGNLADAEQTSTTTTDPSGQRSASTGTRADGVEVPEQVTEFDGLGRAVRETSGDLTTTTDYDVFGNAIATKVGSATGAAGPAGSEVTAERQYDAFGASVEKTLRSDSGSTSAGQRRELDERGRVTSQTDQRGIVERATYTPDGLVEELVSDTGRVTTHEYDARSRALVSTRVSSPHGATVATSYRHDAAGRVTAVFDPADESGTRIVYEYDDFGNVTRTTYPDGAEIRHEFDPHGRKTATVDADGNRTAYAYDESGALVAATQADRDGAPVGGMRYGYDDYGRVNSLERENGVRTDYTFTSAAQVSTEITTGPDGVLSEREYTYAPAGTLSSRIDRVRGDDGRLQATRTEYEYDALDRLVRSSIREGDGADSRVLTRTEYEPTIGGDLAAETVTTHPDTVEAVTTTRRFEYSAVGELTAIVTDGQRQVQAFDVEGNLLASADGDRYEYDAADRLLAHTTPDGVRIESRYWADGARKEHTTSTGATRYYWDGVRLINEVHETPAAGQGTASYLIGTTRHARTTRAHGEDASTSYYGTDRHGNVTDLTDEAGARTTTYGYSDYGVATVAGDRSEPMPAGIGELAYNPFQYAAEYTYRDGTQPLGPRTYDPYQARFLTEDDAPLANLYAFGDLNPITNVDPSGREAQDDWVNVGLAIAGFVFAAVGAGLMLASPGSLVTVFGGVGAFVAGVDFAAAGAELFIALGGPRFLAPEVTMIAAWVVFATGFGIMGGGGAAKYFTRGKKLASAGGNGAPEQVAQTETKATPEVKDERARSNSEADDEFKNEDSDWGDNDDATKSVSGEEGPIIVVDENKGSSQMLPPAKPANPERRVDRAFTSEQQRKLIDAYTSVDKIDPVMELTLLFITRNSDLKDMLLAVQYRMSKAKGSAKSLVAGLQSTPSTFDDATSDAFSDALRGTQEKLAEIEQLMKAHSMPRISIATDFRTKVDQVADDLRKAF